MNTEKSPRTGPNLGVEIFDTKGDDIEFMFLEGKNKITFPAPTAVRIKKEGGNYSQIEFFYPPGQGPRALESYDRKTFVLVSKEEAKTGKGKKAEVVKRGRAYGALVCVGKLRDTLKSYPDIRFDKYVCHTEGLNDWNETAKKLDGLAAPLTES